MGGYRGTRGGAKPRAWRRVGILGVAFFLVACAAQDTRVSAGTALSGAERLFGAGYGDVEDIYIQDVPIDALAIDGLNGLSTVDAEISVTRDGSWVEIDRSGVQLGRLPAPAPSDAEGWGAITAAVIGLARERSDEIASAQPERLYEAVFDGMLADLDAFSRYAGRDEARENRASRDGFGGIGVRIRLIDEGVRILSVMEETPAERSGLKDNDIITRIDNQPTVGLNQREIVRRLRGPLRSRVALTVRRETTRAPLQIEVARAHIVPQTVRYQRLGRIARLRVSGFNQSTTRTLRDKIRQAKREIGPDLAGFILDLRGNPGGLLDQSVAVSDLFITTGRIVSTHGRHPDSHQYFDAEPDDLARDKPVVVIVNGNSASASEIVAAALQDSGRAVVVGTNSFGKGTVQTVLRLPNEGELILTWARFHAPSGYALHKRGVMPDVCTAGLADQAVAEALARLRSGGLSVDRELLRVDLPMGDGTEVDTFRATCPGGQGEPEVDLEVARRLIEDPALYARVLHGAASETASTSATGTRSMLAGGTR